MNKSNEDSPDHEGEILNLDIFESRKVFMTSGTDNKIKIWTFRKILLI